jgi:hypothetical protein
VVRVGGAPEPGLWSLVVEDSVGQLPTLAAASVTPVQLNGCTGVDLWWQAIPRFPRENLLTLGPWQGYFMTVPYNVNEHYIDIIALKC